MSLAIISQTKKSVMIEMFELKETKFALFSFLIFISIVLEMM